MVKSKRHILGERLHGVFGVEKINYRPLMDLSRPGIECKVEIKFIICDLIPI